MTSPFCIVEGNLLFVNRILFGAWKNHLECLKAAVFLSIFSDTPLISTTKYLTKAPYCEVMIEKFFWLFQLDVASKWHDSGSVITQPLESPDE